MFETLYSDSYKRKLECVPEVRSANPSDSCVLVLSSAKQIIFFSLFATVQLVRIRGYIIRLKCT